MCSIYQVPRVRERATTEGHRSTGQPAAGRARGAGREVRPAVEAREGQQGPQSAARTQDRTWYEFDYVLLFCYYIPRKVNFGGIK